MARRPGTATDRKGFSTRGRAAGMVAPTVLVVTIAATAAVALALSAGYSHWTVPAVGPWAIAGGTLHVASRAGIYDAVDAPSSGALLVATPAVFAAATWIVAGAFAARRNVPYRERYLAAAGGGLAVVTLAALVVHLDVPPVGLLWLLAVPLVTAMVATLGFLAVGFLVSGLIIDLRVAGLYTVGTVVFEGLASAAAVTWLDARVEGLLVEAVRTGYAMAGVDATWWAVVGGQLVVGLSVVFACGRLARVRTDAGRAAVLVVSVVTLWSGTAVLVAAAALG